MSIVHGLKFEFPVIRSELDQDRRDAIAARFAEVATAASANYKGARPARPRRLNHDAKPALLKPARYSVIKNRNVKKG